MILERQERLSLRWSLHGKRYQFSVNQDDDIGRAVAKEKAKQIQLDILTGQFDPTLAKYKGDTLWIWSTLR